MTKTATMARFPHYPESVPEELKEARQWVTCRADKAPLIASPRGKTYGASSTQPRTWREYETALAAYSNNEHIAGVGRVITAEEEYVGVDLDDCIDPNTGEITPWADAIVKDLDSYAEISPSLSSIKTWVKAPDIKTAYKKPKLECYPARRYFTVTGLRLSGSRNTIRDATEELEALISEEFPRVERDRTSYDGPSRVLDLEELLTNADVQVFAVASDGQAERKFRILCPWVREHTNMNPTGTYTGQFSSGALFFRCWHSHCSHRSWRVFRHYLESLIYLGRSPRSARGCA